MSQDPSSPQRIVIVESQARFRETLIDRIMQIEGGVLTHVKKGLLVLSRDNGAKIAFVDSRFHASVEHAIEAATCACANIVVFAGQGAAEHDRWSASGADRAAENAGPPEQGPALPEQPAGSEDRPERDGSNGSQAPGPATLDRMEMRLIMETLRQTGFNKAEAARRLGITARTIRNRMKSFELAGFNEGGRQA